MTRSLKSSKSRKRAKNDVDVQLSPKAPVLESKKKVVLIVFFLSLCVLVFLGMGITGVILLVRKAENSKDQIEDNTGDQKLKQEDPYQGMLKYSNEEYMFSFYYPEDWELVDNCSENSSLTPCSIEVSKNGYIWMLELDTIATGGGFGFRFEGITKISNYTVSEVNPAGYDSYMLNQYIAAEDLKVFEEGLELKDKEEIWNHGVLFRDPENFSTLGFGPGKMNDDVPGNFFGIFYKYEYSEGQSYADLPLKGSRELSEKLETMDKITNSFSRDEDRSSKKQWNEYKNAECGYSFDHPQDWSIDEVDSSCIHLFNAEKSARIQISCYHSLPSDPVPFTLIDDGSFDKELYYLGGIKFYAFIFSDGVDDNYVYPYSGHSMRIDGDRLQFDPYYYSGEYYISIVFYPESKKHLTSSEFYEFKEVLKTVKF